VFSGDLEIGSTVTNTVTIAGSGNTTVEGSVFNTGAGVRSLEKSGSGTLTLNGANSYNGATNVNAGKLAINGNSSTSTGNVSVATGATLGGSGLLGGATSVTGTLAPGNSIESLGLGALSFVTGSTYAYELNSSSFAGDLTYSSGSLNIAAGSILTLTELFSGTLATNSKLTLISSVGAWNGGLFTYNSSTLADDSEIVLGSNTWKFNYNDTLGGSNYTSDQTGAANFVTLTVIPEPNVAMVVGGLGVLALLRRRNR
jgi:autotransporter-associated beta strand protein